MRVLFIGDIIGRGGRNATTKLLPELRKSEKINLTIANVENSAAGFGITEKVYHELRCPDKFYFETCILNQQESAH